MRKIWLFLGVALLGALLALGAVACGSDDNNDNNPTATQSLETPISTEGTTPQATEPADGEPTSPPSAFTTVIASENADLGTILTTFDGYTLYTFDNDTGGVSTCTDACASLWPPLVIPGTPTAGEGVSGTLDVVARDDGTTQVTYDGKPLYMYSGDPSPGDTNGDGFAGGIWHAVRLS